MSEKFAASEIVGLGVAIERNGFDFYQTLLKQSKNQKAKEVFEYLAKQEEKHIHVFEALLEKLSGNQPQEMISDDYFAYMNSLASDYVFTRKNTGAELAKEAVSEGQAIDLGIGFEKDSILFYDGMKQIVSAAGRDVINQLIAQEKNHLQQLYALKNKR